MRHEQRTHINSSYVSLDSFFFLLSLSLTRAYNHNFLLSFFLVFVSFHSIFLLHKSVITFAVHLVWRSWLPTDRRCLILMVECWKENLLHLLSLSFSHPKHTHSLHFYWTSLKQLHGNCNSFFFIPSTFSIQNGFSFDAQCRALFTFITRYFYMLWITFTACRKMFTSKWCLTNLLGVL